MVVTLQRVFQESFAAFARSRRLPFHVLRAARFIQACRTSALGQHLRACPNGHVERVYPNSCRHRSCPQCGGSKVSAWIERWTQQLLPCDHYHVTFTVPNELEPLWHRNRREMNAILLGCVRDTLLELLGDAKYLGARPGILAALHTWGRTLTFHPHVHTVVTGGGWDGERWRAVRNGYLLPIGVVSALFRGKVLAAIREAVRSGRVALPSDRSPVRWENVFRALYEKRWNVNIQRYPHARGILSYLGRYLRGGPLRSKRLTALDDRSIQLRYTDHRDGKSKLLALARETFLQRVCWHVPEPRQHHLRLWGLYARACAAQLGDARATLERDASPQRPASPPPECARGGSSGDACPICGAPLRLVSEVRELRVFRRDRDPPERAA